MSEFGKPFWHTLLPQAAPVRMGTGADVSGTVDTIVIGCGLTGASCALALSQLGDGKVLVLEARGIGDGATGRNGGHQWPADQYEDDSYAAAMGHLEHADTAHVRALIAQLPAEEQSSIELHVTGGVDLTFDPEQRPFLEADAVQGGLGVRFLDKDALAQEGLNHAKGVVGGVANQTAGQLVPARLVLSLVRMAQESGVRFVTGQRVTAIEQDGTGWKITTDQRATVHCRHVVHATNGYERSLLPPRLSSFMKYVRGQVVAIPSTPEASHSLSYESVAGVGSTQRYLIQRRRDGVVILGGCRYMSPSLGWDGEDYIVEASVHAKLVESFSTLFNRTDSQVEVSHAWGGTMCFTRDGRPLVGAIKEWPGQYVAVGYCGHGMVRAFSCGRHVAELVRGKPLSCPTISKYFDVDRAA